MDESEQFLLGWSDIVVDIKCVLHGLHNAMKWGLRPHWDSELSDTLHIVILSLRQSSVELADHIPEFLEKCLLYEDVPLDGWNEYDLARRHVWRLLGVDEEALEDLMLVNPRWDQGRKKLLVNAHLEWDPLASSKVTTCIAMMMRWHNFTGSRFAGLSQACRLLLRSMLVGIDSLVAVTLADQAVSKYYLCGYKKITTPIRHFVAITALSAQPLESVTLSMLGEDRFLLLARSCFKGWSTMSPIYAAMTIAFTKPLVRYQIHRCRHMCYART